VLDSLAIPLEETEEYCGLVEEQGNVIDIELQKSIESDTETVNLDHVCDDRCEADYGDLNKQQHCLYFNNSSIWPTVDLWMYLSTLNPEYNCGLNKGHPGFILIYSLLVHSRNFCRLPIPGVRTPVLTSVSLQWTVHEKTLANTNTRSHFGRSTTVPRRSRGNGEIQSFTRQRIWWWPCSHHEEKPRALFLSEVELNVTYLPCFAVKPLTQYLSALLFGLKIKILKTQWYYEYIF